MAKEEKKTVAASAPPPAADPPKEKAQPPKLPDEMNFICSMCEYHYTGKRTGSACSKLKLTGQYCENVERLRAHIIRLDQENMKHRRYVGAFNSKPYYTEEEIRQLYDATFASGAEASPEEFADYCRTMGMRIV